MSHSNMKAVYNSHPAGVQFAITEMNESAGSFSGTVTESTGKQNISGSFSFNNQERKTELWFSTPDAKWSFKAAYNTDGAFFEEWTGLKTEKANPDATGLWTFYKDMSGEGSIGSGVNVGSGSITGYRRG